MGPRFECEDQSGTIPANFSKTPACELLYEASDQSIKLPIPDRYPRVKNVFQISWLSKRASDEAIKSKTCEAPRTLHCSTIFGTYNIRIVKNATGQPQFLLNFKRHECMNWTDQSPINTSFYYQFWDGDGLRNSHKDESDLKLQFPRT